MPANSNFCNFLDSGLIVPVPPASFHLTLADLIWDNAYHYANENSELHLRYAIAQILQYQQLMTQTNQFLNFGTDSDAQTIGVCLVPKDENSTSGF